MKFHSSPIPQRLLLVTVCLTSTVWLVGCRTLKPAPPKTAAPPPVREPFRLPPPGPDSAIYESEAKPTAEEPSTGEAASLPLVLPSRNLDANPAASEAATYNLPMDMTRDIDDPDERLPIELNFDADEISTVVEMFSVVLEFQYYIDAGISGTVTMSIKTEMTRLEAWQLFEHVLWISGAYASRNNGFIHILPFAKMPKERRLLTKHAPIPNVDVSVIRLYNTTPAEMTALVQPFLTDGAATTPITHLNSLMIVETPSNMEKIRELINRLDVMGEAQWPQISIACHYVDVMDLLEELKQVLPTLGFPVTTSEKGDGRSIKLVALERPQVLLAAAPTREVLDEVRRWVEVLDREQVSGSSEEHIFFYDVKYNTADELSEAISVFFSSTRSAQSTSSTRATGTDANNNTGTNTTRVTRETAARTARNQATQVVARRTTTDEPPATVFDVPVTIFADGRHNRLVLLTTNQAYARLRALLELLDTPPRQVMIQMYIIDITLTDNTAFGFQYAALRHKIGELEFSFQPKSDGFTFNFGSDVPANEVINFIQAIAGASNTRVLSSPQLIVVSDEEASINVGQSVPVATREDSGSTTDSRIIADIQYQDTGTILNVTPHITAKGLVSLDLRQEVSEAIATQSSEIQSPTIRNSTVETSMLVGDGSTVLMGGLIETRYVDAASGVPGLGKIPLLGRFFRADSRDETRRELMLLINVKVLEATSDHSDMVQRYNRAIDMLRDEKALAR